jgi:membrane-associated phospholipid phosphatase
LVGLAIAFVDRPFSTWSHSALHGIAFFKWLTWIVDPIPWAVAVVLVAAGLSGASGWRPGAVGKTLLAVAVATAIAIFLKDELKWLFGRPWPEGWVAGAPSWIGTGTDRFYFFKNNQGYWSFPSGHMTVITAPMAVLWRRVPRWRWLWGAAIALVAIGLAGSDFHFVGDMVAGTFLGAACAAGTLAFIK